MLTIVAASSVLVIVLLVALRLNAGLSCRESRTILLRVPLAAAWEQVRDFGALHVRHGRGRPVLLAESSELVRGDGSSAGSVWRQRGRWHGRPWWAEIEAVAVEPPRRIVVSLARDALGTDAGLAYHRCIVELEEEGPHATKVRLRLRARTRGARLTLARAFAHELLHARLLDLSLRSLKDAIDGATRVEPVPRAAAPGAPHAAAVTDGIPPAAPAAPAQPSIHDHL